MAVTDPNKVRFGIRNLHWAPYTEGENGAIGTWGKPLRIPGAVSFDPTSQGQKNVFYADDMEYFVYTKSNGESGNLVVAKYTIDYLTHMRGHLVDSNGAVIKTGDRPQGKGAILYEMQGDVCPIRRVLYCCSSGEPSSGTSTTEGGITVQTETAEITAVNLDFGNVTAAGLTLTKIANPGVFESFFDSVLLPAVQ